MKEADHKLILDYWNGRFHPRCGCGRWHKAPIPIRVQKLRDVYDRIEGEHYRHVEEVEPQRAAPA